MTIEHVGAHIRQWRRRRNGMSQKVLAELSGLSQSYISQIESGQRPLDRKHTQVAIAGALNITVTQLLGQPGEPADPMKDRAIAHVPAIRAALIELSAGETRRPARDADTLRAAVRDVTELRNAADYAAVAPLLPDLLYDVAGHRGDLAPQMVEALFSARYALKQMGFPDLAREAAAIGVRVAEEHDNTAWRGLATLSSVQAFPPESAPLGQRLAERVADEVQGVDAEVYGNLHLIAGLQAAVANRASEAWAHLDEATDVAQHLGEPQRCGKLTAGAAGLWFGPTNVDYWRVGVAAELGDAGQALAVAGRIDTSLVPVPNRHVYYHGDMARALAAERRDEQAMLSLVRAERVAPLHFRLSPVARDLAASLVQRARRRAVGGDFATLVHSLGLTL